MILGPGDVTEYGARRGLLVVDAEAPHDRLDDRLLIGLVVDHEILRQADGRLARNRRGNAQGFNIAAQQAHTKGMERRNYGLGDGEAADQLIHALHHLGGGFVGEGHRQDGFRHHAQMLDQMGDAVGDDARLAAARAGQDEHRAIGGFDGFTLLRIELGEERQSRELILLGRRQQRRNDAEWFR